MASPANPSLDLVSPAAVPYFNWDAPVTNAEVRSALGSGSEDVKLFWIARILREARYPDVWQYLSLTKDVLPRWDVLRARLGRQRPFWEYLITGWRHDGLVPG
ncbi:MAG TPA: hypothetical protein VJN18_00065 [Polyangiaceae bacterium]|nr:hypothetical protein [Polyangiaceae bacterium]